MSREQIEFAKRHDWFIADNGNGTIQCLDDYTDGSGNRFQQAVTFSDFRSLLDWAGY